MNNESQTDALETVEAGEEEVEVKEKTSRDPKDLLKQLEEEGDIAADYLEGLLDIADLDGDIDIDVENDRASLAIMSPSDSSGGDRKSTRLNSSHVSESRMPSSA